MIDENNNDKAIVAIEAIVNRTYKNIMKPGVDYGRVPGCGKNPVLLKPGAEKLILAFNLFTECKVETIELEAGHREFRCSVSLISRKDDKKIGEGIGSCSTLEKKWARPNPPDMWNTCLKMAKKRALVDAVLTSLGASMLFTQDLIETENEIK